MEGLEESPESCLTLPRLQLKAKYLAERDRRLRQGFEQQYITIGESEKFKHWLDDLWNKGPERQPISVDTDVLVLGSGFSGLLTASKLKDAGITNFKMIDGSGDFGGTVGWDLDHSVLFYLLTLVVAHS